jgi:hypothetical protein
MIVKLNPQNLDEMDIGLSYLLMLFKGFQEDQDLLRDIFEEFSETGKINSDLKDFILESDCCDKYLFHMSTINDEKDSFEIVNNFRNSFEDFYLYEQVHFSYYDLLDDDNHLKVIEEITGLIKRYHENGKPCNTLFVQLYRYVSNYLSQNLDNTEIDVEDYCNLFAKLFEIYDAPPLFIDMMNIEQYLLISEQLQITRDNDQVFREQLTRSAQTSILKFIRCQDRISWNRVLSIGTLAGIYYYRLYDLTQDRSFLEECRNFLQFSELDNNMSFGWNKECREWIVRAKEEIDDVLTLDNYEFTPVYQNHDEFLNRMLEKHINK